MLCGRIKKHFDYALHTQQSTTLKNGQTDKTNNFSLQVTYFKYTEKS